MFEAIKAVIPIPKILKKSTMKDIHLKI